MADSRWMQHVERGLGAIAARSHRTPAVALAVAGALVAFGLYSARTLSMNADLIDLLPRFFRSVTDIEKLKQRFGGIGYVVVVGQGAEDEKLVQFARDLEPVLEAMPEIRFVDYERPARFFEDRALYYLDTADLAEIERRIDARLAWERQTRNPLFIDLEEEPAPPLDFSDIESKYTGSSSRRLAGDGQDYYLDPRERMIVILAKPRASSTDLDYSHTLVTQVEDALAKLDLSKYGPSFRVGLTGTYKKKLDQQRQISNDLALASTVAFALLLFYLMFHFRSVIAVGFVLAPVSAGLAWTYGWVGAAYGQVNLLTGFLGAILGGLGAEHGIHLLGRYEALRAEGADSETATRESFSHTGGSALISSFVAALTFLSLAISEFRAFREFGVIAAGGMMISIAAYVLILPALLGVASRLGWRPKAARTVTGEGSELARFLPRAFKQITVVAAAVTALLAFTARDLRFNYDFAALEDSSLPSFQLDRKVNRILGYSQTPVIVLTDDIATEAQVVRALSARRAELGPASTIDFIAALDDLVPDEQSAKHEILQRMARTLDKLDPASFDGETKAQLQRAKRMVAAAPFDRDDIPETVRRQFQGVGEFDSGFVLVFPAISLADGAKVRLFAKEVREIDMGGGGNTLSAAGEAMVLADILEMVTREAPPVLATAVLSVLVAMWITLGSLRSALICLAPTVVSILMLVGLMPIVDLPFNYLNIVAVPVLIGTTVDAGVHLVSRFSERNESFAATYGETGRAICGGLLTSAVGFGALLLADHPGLNSIGKLVNLGFGTNLIVTLVAFPAFILLVQRRNQRQTATTAGAPTGGTEDNRAAGGIHR